MNTVVIQCWYATFLCWRRGWVLTNADWTETKIYIIKSEYNSHDDILLGYMLEVQMFYESTLSWSIQLHKNCFVFLNPDNGEPYDDFIYFVIHVFCKNVQNIQ